MRWGRDRAEAVLQLRCILVNGQWPAFERAHSPLLPFAQPLQEPLLPSFLSSLFPPLEKPLLPFASRDGRQFHSVQPHLILSPASELLCFGILAQLLERLGGLFDIPIAHGEPPSFFIGICCKKLGPVHERDIFRADGAGRELGQLDGVDFERVGQWRSVVNLERLEFGVQACPRQVVVGQDEDDAARLGSTRAVTAPLLGSSSVLSCGPAAVVVRSRHIACSGGLPAGC